MRSARWIAAVAGLLVGLGSLWGQTPTTGPAEAGSPTTRPVEVALDPNAPPDRIVRENWAAIVAVLRDKDLDMPTKEWHIERIATPRFDFPLMARLAAGRTAWTRMTPAQRARYVELFTRHLKSSYRGKIALYKGERVRHEDPNAPPATPRARRSASRRPGVREVTIHLVSSDRDLVVIHKFRRTEGGWMIYDIEIEGVSIVLSYRSQFEDILASGDIEKLLDRLQETLPR